MSHFIQMLNKIMTPDGHLIDPSKNFAPMAYDFVRYAMTAINPHEDDKPHHVTGRELSRGLHKVALSEFGCMAQMVLSRWGITETRDFGLIVYDLIAARLFGKQDSDSLDDFNEVFDFVDAFANGSALYQDIDSTSWPIVLMVSKEWATQFEPEAPKSLYFVSINEN